MAPLNEQQKELLSAFVDGEVNDEERLEALELLEREDAQAYLEELQALADVVHKHAPVRAPVGLSGRVMGALEDEFKSPQAGPGEEPFHGNVSFSWRTPLYAAAAAILVSLAIMFGPGMLTPGEETSSSVAREALSNLPGPEQEQARGPESVEHSAASDELRRINEDTNVKRGLGELNDAMEGAERRDRDEANANEEQLDKNDRSAFARRVARGGSSEAPQGEVEEVEKLKEDGKPKAGHEDEAGRVGLGGGASAGGTRRPGGYRGEAPKDSDTTYDSEDKRREGDPQADTGEPYSESDGDDAAVEAREPAEAPPSPEDNAATGEVVELTLSEAEGMLARNDVLWVSTLYGEAGIDEDAEGNESVTVELTEDKLERLLGALRRLAADQGYGQLEGAPGRAGEVEAGPAESARISGYVPDSHEKEEARKGAEKPRTVRVVIRTR